MAAQITLNDLKRVVVSRLNQWIAQLGTAESQMSRVIVRGIPFSPLALRNEVESLSEIGIEYLSMEARKMGYVLV